MSPRRSSRARTTNPPTAPTNSSTSSISSSRAERTTRSNNKLASPQRSGNRSQSLDDPDDAKPQPRRTRSGHDEIKEVAQQQRDDELEDEDEEEVTRCVCGQAEYPGLPGPTLDALKQQAKEAGSSVPADIATDDTAGIFIQCDVCKVWQHGGCVGILNDEAAPEYYFCEDCRKDLHQVATTGSGQRFSRYIPVAGNPSPVTSPAPPTRDGRSSRSKEAKPRASAEALAAKRRPTMNSYDEDEQLQRAIEESKKDGLVSSEDGNRRPKRSRSDSEERKVSTKRQRTGSGSSTPEVDKAGAIISSSDEALALHKPREDPSKKIRGAAARNHREKELRDQKERERQEAASRRKARSERRRGEDSDAEDNPKDPPSAVSTPPAPDTSTRSHKKKPFNKGRRTGRNQYTRDLPPSSLHNTLDPNDDTQMRTRSRSRSVVRETESPRGANGNSRESNNGVVGPFGADSRPSRPKYLNITRTSFNEMKKRVAGILEFVNRAQEESARVPEALGVENGNGVKEKAVAEVTINGGSLEADFASLDTGDMLRDLKGKLVQWEDEYGRWPRG